MSRFLLAVCATFALIACSEVYGEARPALDGEEEPALPLQPAPDEPLDASGRPIVEASATVDATVDASSAAPDAGEDELLARTIALADGADVHLFFTWKRAAGTTAARDMAIYLGAGSPLLTVRTQILVEASVYLLSWIEIDEDVTYDLRLRRIGTRVDVEISPPLGKITLLAQTDTTEEAVRVMLPNAAKLAAPIRLD